MANNAYLKHHGILGQKWGVRRYQNEDGTLTAAGKKRYYNSDGTLTKAGKKKYYTDAIIKNVDYMNEYNETPEGKKLSNSYSNAIEKYENGELSDEKFIEIEHKYLYKQGQYTAQKILEEYGLETMKDIWKSSWRDENGKIHDINTVKDFIDAWADEEAYVHVY